MRRLLVALGFLSEDLRPAVVDHNETISGTPDDISHLPVGELSPDLSLIAIIKEFPRHRVRMTGRAALCWCASWPSARLPARHLNRVKPGGRERIGEPLANQQGAYKRWEGQE